MGVITDRWGSGVVRTADCWEISLKGPAARHKDPAPLMTLLRCLKHKYTHIIKANMYVWGLYAQMCSSFTCAYKLTLCIWASIAVISIHSLTRCLKGIQSFFSSLKIQSDTIFHIFVTWKCIFNTFNTDHRKYTYQLLVGTKIRLGNR